MSHPTPETPATANSRRRSRPPLLPLLSALLALPLSMLSAEQGIIPFSEIKAGMTGIGRTVFSGTRIDEFQVEVIGTLQNIAPKRNLILVRLTGGPLATTGVLAGMSGSPVYFGDRLAGAVGFTWAFSREALAGVTPIQEMLSIEDKETASPASSPRAHARLPSESGPAGLAYLRDPGKLAAHFATYFDGTLAKGQSASPMNPIGTPLLFSGFPRDTVDALAPGLLRAGLIAVQGGSTGKSPATGEARLQPGSGVGIRLVRGDVDISAICTVTYRDADRLLACGHPLLNLGATDLLMTTASVNGLMPSLQESFKFASAGEDVGAFRQDRATGVLGYLGKKPRTIPVRVEVQPDKGRARRYAFDVVEDPFLAPYLLYAALNGVLSSEEKDYGDVTLSYKDGSTILVAGEEDISLRNLFSGDSARLYASGTVAFLTQLLLNSEYRAVHINGINIILGASEEQRTARLERAWVSKDRVRAGETVQVSVTLRPFRGPEVTRQMDVQVPEAVQPGRLMLQVGDGLALARTEADDDDFTPKDLKQLISLINHLRSNNKIYAVLTRGDNGIVFQGQRLPNLPPSVAQVMVRPQTRGNYLRVWYRGIAEEVIDTDYALTGYKLLSLDVEE